MSLDSTVPLDETDWRLVEALQENARLTLAELGRQLELSPPAVAERVRRLEVLGVIAGYRADIDPARLGLPLEAVVRIQASSANECQTIGDRISKEPEVLRCWRITGSDSHVLHLAVRSVEHLDDALSRVMPRSGGTVTGVVLNTPVPRRTITRTLAQGTQQRIRPTR
ncbi:MAG: Lrp/AsnC family transcriptional regulator [Candidatus Dormibacteraeota bacterium]|uniref:Lrp/AsnC family transcriptional regulator n=1 Tax=Candidatus Dormiibacter inghamiae TaxID=3127013 RepID=A0A934K9Q8_9BACT|nr:Lrp/AsnC family transcriptional regulator [Candidatus Dormibacteraeota bacterium]MBJ7604848.1 Lrp/AsnC family transcriptional regulator [Candidatus Dormibacteraeota bacterium]